MEQLFAVRPNFLTDDVDNDTPPKNRSSIIDKYIEFRMKLTEHDRLNKLKREKSETALSETPELFRDSSVNNFLSTYQEEDNSNNTDEDEEPIRYTEDSSEKINEREDDASLDGYSIEQQNDIVDVDDSREEQFVKKYKYDTGSEKDEWIDDAIEERESCEVSDDDNYDETLEVSNKVARILRIIRGYEPKEYLDDKAYDDDEELLTSRRHHFTYSAFFIMIFLACIVTILRKLNTLFEAVKVLFDTIFATYWNWAKKAWYPGDSTESNLLLFMLSTPILGFLVIMYAGFNIMYIGNKALLLRVPDRLSTQINLNSIREIQY